jgi:ATP-binding cassette subfamily B protein
VLFSIFISIVEAIGISAIMPFIDISTNFSVINENENYKNIYTFFNFQSEINFAIAFGLALFMFYLFRGVVNLLYTYSITSFGQRFYAIISSNLFNKYLSLPYKDFVKKNSSFLTKTIITEASLLTNIISSILTMISEILVVVLLYALMLWANWKITLVFTMLMILKVLFLTQTVSKKIKKVGVERERLHSRFYESINRLFGNFKQIKLQSDSLLMSTKKSFNNLVHKYSHTNTINGTLSVVPRLFLETSGFALIVLLIVYLLFQQQGNVSYILPTLSLFVLALYRLLPSMNRIITGYNNILYYHKAIDIVNEELRSPQEIFGNDVVFFSRQIKLDNVYFSYSNGENILSNIDLTINKGEHIAFTGVSGSGKTSLVDIVAGLLQPTSGSISIDGVELEGNNLQSWRSKIGYIPQQIYLFDGSVADNVCFGRAVDNRLLEKVLRQANIFDFLQTKNGLETLVGEGGIQFSGGQKQRIAIARALYGNPELLVLDEATSALDSETEKKIMREIYDIAHNKTLIIIAHRLSTIDNCDKVYRLHKGKIQ